jgi:nucleotide-binding universal stress UspA family protein
MSSQNRVIVALSDRSETHPGVEWAVSYAASVQKELELVHVVDLSWQSTPAPLAESELLLAERDLRDVATRCATKSGVPVHSTVLAGNPTRLLVEHAAKAHVLVLGTRSSQGFGASLFNTRALRVASRVNVSTVVVPHAPAAGSGIVVGVDGSTFSVAPLAFAAREADRLGEALTVMYSWHAPRPWTDGAIEDWEAEPEDEARRILAEAVAGLAQTYPDLHVATEAVFARAADALYNAAEGARMLVVGSHGRHGFDKAWLGSTSEELILAMPTTVAVIR